MTLVIEQDYRDGIPQTITANWDALGVGWHWTAGGTGRAGAESTIRHFINTRLTVNASYHILLYREGGKTFARWIVRPDRCAHSFNPSLALKPRTGDAREQARFAEVRRILGTRAWDPNSRAIAVSFCGMPADLKAALRDSEFVRDVQELARILERRPGIVDRPHFGHGWIQPQTRYELDSTTGGDDLMIGPVIYGASVPDAGTEEDMKLIEYRPGTAKLAPGAWVRARPGGVAEEESPLVVLGPNGYEARTFIGFVEGEMVDGSNRWGVYAITSGDPDRFAFTVESNVLEVVPNVTEVVKEVPTGITQEQLDKAVADAKADERNRIAKAEADRVRSL